MRTLSIRKYEIDTFVSLKGNNSFKYVKKYA